MLLWSLRAWCESKMIHLCKGVHVSLVLVRLLILTEDFFWLVQELVLAKQQGLPTMTLRETMETNLLYDRPLSWGIYKAAPVCYIIQSIELPPALGKYKLLTGLQGLLWFWTPPVILLSERPLKSVPYGFPDHPTVLGSEVNFKQP